MLDFTLIKTSEEFELLCEKLIEALGFEIVSRPARGPGQGKDIVAVREIEDEFDGKLKQKFLIECKHFAKSDKSVQESDTKSIIDRMVRNQCDHYLLITSTIASVTVRDQIEAINNNHVKYTIDNKDIHLRAVSWYKDDLDEKLKEHPEVWEKYTGQKLLPKKSLKALTLLENFLERSIEFLPDKKLFEEELYFFPEKEKKLIQNIKSVLTRKKGERIALLTGDPASGKTVMSIVIAKELQKEGYTILFHKLTSKSNYESIWSDFINYDHPKVLFILETCHLNIDVANHIYTDFHKIQYGACLFVSRDLPKQFRCTTELDNLDIFDSLKDRKFRVSLTNEEIYKEKINGIIGKYKDYYEKINGVEFVVGDRQKVVNRVHKNLLTLYYYLQFWPDTMRLDALDKKMILNRIYERYLGTNPHSDLILKCAALFKYEIQIDTLESEKDAVDYLVKDGILKYNSDVEYHSLYHSDFAELLLKSYEARPSFSRKYDGQREFIIEQLKSYILSFEKYPPNLEEVYYNLVTNRGLRIASILLNDSQILEITAHYYQKHGSPVNLLQIFYKLQDFEYKVVKNLLEKIPSKVWVEKFKHFGISGLSYGLMCLREINIEKASNVLSEMSISDLLERLENASLGVIGNSLVEFNKVSPRLNLGRKIYQRLDLNIIANKTKTASFEHLGKCLSELGKIDLKKTQQLYQKLRMDEIIQKAEKSNFKAIGKTFNELKNINFKKTQLVYENLNFEALLEKARQVSFEGIGRALNELKNINWIRTKEIYNRIDISEIIKKAENVGFDQIAHTLSELNKIHDGRTREIYYQMELDFLVNKAKDKLLSIQKLAKSFITLLKVDPKQIKLKKIFDEIELNSILKKSKQASFSNLALALSDFQKVNSEIAKAILENLTVEHLVQRAQAEKLESVGPAFHHLAQIDSIKTSSTLVRINFKILLQNNQNITFDKLANTVNNLGKLDKEKARQVYHMFSVKNLVLKAKHSNKFFLKQSLSKLEKIDYYLTHQIREEIYRNSANKKPYDSFEKTTKGEIHGSSSAKLRN